MIVEALTLSAIPKEQEAFRKTKSSTLNSHFWENYFRTYDILLRVIPYRELLQSLLDAAGIRPGQTILDAGCGTGNLAHFLLENINVYMLDQSAEALAKARLKFPGIKQVQSSLTDSLPLKDASMDAIVCNNVLYTLPESAWTGLLKECHRVLRPGGRLVLCNPNTGFSPRAFTGRISLKALCARVGAKPLLN